MLVTVELWGTEIAVPVGSTLTLHCDGDDIHPPTIEQTEFGLGFYPECPDFTAEIDGEPLLV
jgi:hypothetical protein